VETREFDALWAYLLTECLHFNTLWGWLTLGAPGKLRFDLLQCPAGLLYAIRETYSMQRHISPDRVTLTCTLRRPVVGSSDVESELLKPKLDSVVVLSDLVLRGATYHPGSKLLEFLPDCSASDYGKKLDLEVRASSELRALDSEEYLCPLYVHSLLPATGDLLAHAAVRSTDTEHLRQLDCANAVTESPPLLLVPLLTTEDVESCKMYAVALHAGGF
jgi:hypothetical protein